MTSVVLLLGGECTGKTTLARELSTRIANRPVEVVPEALRDFVARHDRTPQRDEQAGIWRTQTELLDQAIATSADNAVVIADPAPLMTAVYSLQYFDDDSLLAPALAATQSGDLVVWCAPDLPWEPDGIQRDGPTARDATERLLVTHIAPELREVPVITVAGTSDERVAHVLAHLH